MSVDELTAELLADRERLEIAFIRLRERLNQSASIACAEALRVLDGEHTSRGRS
jgi:hypothetical protein